MKRNVKTIKKLILLLTALMLMLLSGCARSQTFHIDDDGVQWSIVSVQSNVDGGNIAALGGESSGDEGDVARVEMTCTAENGYITLHDKTSDMFFSGIYDEIDSTVNSVCYSVIIQNVEGMAVVSTTELSDGTSYPTLVISIGDYTLNFSR